MPGPLVAVRQRVLFAADTVADVRRSGDDDAALVGGL
jgi:hypothetical protein